MAPGGVSGLGDVNPPQARSVTESGGDHPFHVETRGDPKGTWVNDISPNYKGEHIHPGYWTGGIAMERGGGDHQYLFEGKCLPPQNPEWFPNR